jgi:hypothetical protein
MADDKFVSGMVAGGLAGGALASLLKSRPVAAAPDTAKLDYLTTLVQQVAADQAVMADAIASIPSVEIGVEVTDRLDAIIDSMNKEFLFNPQKMCSTLWLNFPNLCFPAQLAFAITLPPGATVTFNTAVAPGFVEVLVGKPKVVVDVDFVMSMMEFYDNNRFLGGDPALTTMEQEINEWVPVQSTWILTLTNNSVFFNCTFHTFNVAYAIEAHLFNYIKEKLRKLGLTIIPEEVFT